MIEIKHDGPVRVVDEAGLSITFDGTWRLLATYSTQQRQYVPPRYNSYTGHSEPEREELMQVQMFILGQSTANALAEAQEAVRVERLAVAQAKAREEELSRGLEEAKRENERLKFQAERYVEDRDRACAARDAHRTMMQRGEEALADLREKYRKIRAEVGEARARELLGE
jgi:hypothetical protein